MNEHNESCFIIYVNNILHFPQNILYFQKHGSKQELVSVIWMLPCGCLQETLNANWTFPQCNDWRLFILRAHSLWWYLNIMHIIFHSCLPGVYGIFILVPARTRALAVHVLLYATHNRSGTKENLNVTSHKQVDHLYFVERTFFAHQAPKSSNFFLMDHMMY